MKYFIILFCCFFSIFPYCVYSQELQESDPINCVDMIEFFYKRIDTKTIIPYDTELLIKDRDLYICYNLFYEKDEFVNSFLTHLQSENPAETGDCFLNSRIVIKIYFCNKTTKTIVLGNNSLYIKVDNDYYYLSQEFTDLVENILPTREKDFFLRELHSMMEVRKRYNSKEKINLDLSDIPFDPMTIIAPSKEVISE